MLELKEVKGRWETGAYSLTMSCEKGKHTLLFGEMALGLWQILLHESWDVGQVRLDGQPFAVARQQIAWISDSQDMYVGLTQKDYTELLQVSCPHFDRALCEPQVRKDTKKKTYSPEENLRLQYIYACARKAEVLFLKLPQTRPSLSLLEAVRDILQKQKTVLLFCAAQAPWYSLPIDVWYEVQHDGVQAVEAQEAEEYSSSPKEPRSSYVPPKQQSYEDFKAADGKELEEDDTIWKKQ